MLPAFIPGKESIPSYYAYADTSDNGCGQAAVAVLVDFWRRTDLYPTAKRRTHQLVEAIYRQHPPDTPRAWWGCTPGHVENIFRALNFATDRRSGAADAYVDLVRSVEIGCPSVVLVDLGKLGDKWGLHHYVVVVGVDDRHVYLRNMLDIPKAKIPIDTFMEAWHCWALPAADWKYAGICAAPSRARLPKRSAVHAASVRAMGATAETAAPAPDDPAEIRKASAASERLALEMEEGRHDEGAEVETTTAGAGVSRKRAAKAPAAAKKARGSDKLGRVLDELKQAGGSVRIDGEEITSRPDAPALLARLDADVLRQFEEKVGDGLRESRHRRAIWDNEATRPGKDGPELPVHYVADVDTRVGWVDEDWRACKSAACPENVRPSRPKSGAKKSRG